MTEPEQEAVLRELQELRREVRWTRRWAVLSGVFLGMIIFTPKAVVWIGECVADAVVWLQNVGIELSTILSLLAILGVIVAAAAIISRSSVSRKSESGARQA